MIGRWIITALGALTFAFGAWGFADPASMGESVGLGAHSAFGLSELRAVYGGVIGTMGIALLAAPRVAGGAHWTRMVGAIYLACAITRVTSLILGGMDETTFFAGCYEVVVGLTLLKAAQSLD